MIKAPFNFVPLNDEPYLAGWADSISQDIPFEDGISGTIELQIETKTPTFVGDEVKKDSTEVCEFCHICHIVEKDGKKKYFIPGTSIKGMIRNVMEILSFGKMAQTQVQNQSFSIRDLNDNRFYRKKVTSDNVRCGWLSYNGMQYQLEDCGKPDRITAEELDEIFNMKLLDFITNGGNFKSDENRTAQKKYEMFKKAGHKETELTGNFMKNGSCGTIVFTGQPGARRMNERQGKHKEFVFSEKAEQKIVIPEMLFKVFDTIHQNSPDYVGIKKKNKEGEQKTCYRNLLKAGKKIPVFFIKDGNGEIEAMGLSYMFKYPAFNSVYNGIPEALLKLDGHDLCECIFGYTSKSKSLKGRVHFSPAILTGEAMFCEKTKLALSKPHPSYYPLYLGDGQTWNSKSIKIAGRKRYPVRETEDIYGNEGTDDMNRTIRPIAQGSIFKGMIRFHNLRPIELGLLLDAIDFCQHSECFHNIGQGKPLGYGKVKLSVTPEKENMKRISDGEAYASQDARKEFEKEMTDKFKEWSDSPQLKELFAMAKGIERGYGSKFQYMNMSTQSDQNEFKTGSRNYCSGTEQLGAFTQILSGDVKGVPLRDNASVRESRIDVELKLIEEQEERERKLVKEAEEQRAREEAFARQQAEKERKLAEQREAERLEQLKKESNDIAAQADKDYKCKKYVEAKKWYEKAASYGFETYQEKIKICEDEQRKIDETKNKDFSTFLAGLNISSLNAFATNLKKRNELSPITADDIPLIINKIQASKDKLKSKDAKKLLKRETWGEMEKALGAEMTDTIYNAIKS